MSTDRMTLSRFRTLHGMRQSDVLNEQVKLSTLSALERGKRSRVDLMVVNSLANSLGAPPGEVFEAILESRLEALASETGFATTHTYRRPKALEEMLREPTD